MSAGTGSTSMEALYLAAWIDGLHTRADAPAVRPATALPRRVRPLHTPATAYVPLSPRTGPR